MAPVTRAPRLQDHSPAASLHLCKATALLCKALHSVQLRNIPQPPQRTWAEAPFAPHSLFAQKRYTKPVGGRGISAFSVRFFLRRTFSPPRHLIAAHNAAFHRFEVASRHHPDILAIHTVFQRADRGLVMNEENTGTLSSRGDTIAAWDELLQDDAALLENPGAHHKALLKSAHMLHQTQIIDRDGLSDLLEQADGALAYAVEALLDQPSGE